MAVYLCIFLSSLYILSITATRDLSPRDFYPDDPAKMPHGHILFTVMLVIPPGSAVEIIIRFKIHVGLGGKNGRGPICGYPCTAVKARPP